MSHSTPDPVGEGERWTIKPWYDEDKSEEINRAHGPAVGWGDEIAVVPESRATDAEAERDRLREALEAILVLLTATTGVIRLGARVRKAKRIARSALNTGTDDG